MELNSMDGLLQSTKLALVRTAVEVAEAVMEEIDVEAAGAGAAMAVAAAAAEAEAGINQNPGKGATLARLAGWGRVSLSTQSQLGIFRKIASLNQESPGIIPSIQPYRVEFILRPHRLDQDPANRKRLYGCPSFRWEPSL